MPRRSPWSGSPSGRSTRAAPPSWSSCSTASTA
jgi:hypothetical protein